MKPAPILDNEQSRMAQLNDYQILDTAPEEVFDNITKLATEICQTPIALVSLVDQNRQWFKSKIGIELSETPREISFCGHAIHETTIMMVEDATKDERFYDNPIVTGPLNLRFYAGAQLLSSSGLAIGTLCIIDQKPRTLTEQQKELLKILAKTISDQLELRLTNRKLQKKHQELEDTYNALVESKQDLLLNAKLSGLAFLASGIAHEINNPLSIALGRAQFLLRNPQEFGDNPKVKTWLEQICEACQRVASIVSNLRAFSNTTVAQTISLCKAEDIPESLNLMLREEIKKQNIKMQFSKIPRVTLNISLHTLTHALHNLIQNSIENMENKENKSIDISFSKNDNFLSIDIIDSGIGIAEEIREKVLIPFFTTKSLGTQGIGMGLSCTHGIAKKSGGSLMIMPNDPTSGGAHVRLSIPIHRAYETHDQS